ncbi:MAG TPA: hypothetical protein VFV87_20205 [Pirellulaceae bacterium]|nr:hypothetical protein [Pirellulaceae bacterium]
MRTLQARHANLDWGATLKDIRSSWSEGERERRIRVAQQRQRRLLRMLTPSRQSEAFDCHCDVEADEGGRSRRFVAVAG